MSKQPLSYIFTYIENCNMCDSPTGKHKILGKRLNTSQGRNPWKKIGITTTIARCSNCGLVYSNPQPVPVDINSHYGVPPENYWKEGYFKVQPHYFENQLEKLSKLMPFREGMRSLDIGAGLGKAMIALAKAGFDSYGFEASAPFYEKAISVMGISPEKLKCTTIENADYPDEFFDFISFGAVLEHLYNPSDSIQIAMKWLKPGGLIHIEIPSSKWLLNDLINIFYRLTGSDYVANVSPMHNPYHLYEFDLKSFSEHAKKHNYEIIWHEYYVCVTYMPKFIDLFLQPLMKWTNTGMQLCVWLKKK